MRYGPATLAAALIGSLAAPALAQPDGDSEPRAIRHAATILLHEDESVITPQRMDFGPAWLAQNLRLEKRSGFKYSRRLDVGPHGMTVGVKGPVVRKKRLGLSLEVRF